MTEAMDEFMWPEERAGLERASSKWWLFLGLGVVTTLALLVALGLVVTGLGELMSAGRYRSTLGIIAGVVLVVGGVLAAVWPDITLWALAFVVGVDLIVSGVARIMGAVQLRVEGWGCVLLGLRMLFFGISEIMFGLALHHVHSALDTPGAAEPPPEPI